jgi:hypothetical protein
MALMKKNGHSERLPSGVFTIDAQGQIISSTVSQSFGVDVIKAIGEQILSILAGAREAHMFSSELVVHYGAFKIIAREMRGGAIVFLRPKSFQPISLYA